MNVQSKLAILPSIAIAIVLTSCASPNSSPAQSVKATQIAPPTKVIIHRVKPGDRLSDIAKIYTGSAENWREIAAFNEIANPRKLLVGAEVEIPESLTANYVDENQQVATTELVERPAGSVVDVTKDEETGVVIQSVNNNRNFELKPITASTESAVEQTRSTSESLYVKVVGSYYPKGVYSQPAAYSQLLLRVAPGTVFEFESKVNDWYKVQTDKGVGYIRLVDGLILE